MAERDEVEYGSSPHEGRSIAEQPNPAEAREATYFRRIRAAVTGNANHAELGAAVAAARRAGDSWAVIGAALGVSRQAAEERYGR